jgi:hypothetical protein
MADVVLSLTVVGDANPLPVPIPRGQTRTLRIAATDRVTRLPLDAAVERLIVRSPEAETVYSGSELTEVSTGVWTRAVTFGIRGRWRASAVSALPSVAVSDTLPLVVIGSLADTPVPPPPAPAVVDAAQSAAAAEQSAIDADAAADRAEAAAGSAGALSVPTFASRAVAATTIAAGSVAASVNGFIVQGFAALGDCPAHRYARRLRSGFAGGLPTHGLYILDPDGVSLWELDETEVTWEMAGGFGVLPPQTPTVNIRAAADLIRDYLEAKGGGVIRPQMRRYLMGGGPYDLPAGVRLIGSIPASIAQTDPDNNVRVDWARAPALYLQAGTTIGGEAGCVVEENVILHADDAGVELGTPGPLLAYQRDLRDRGTAIHIGRTRPAPDAKVRNNIIVGFDTAIIIERSEWGQVEGNKIDANYGIVSPRNGTPLFIERNFVQSFRDSKIETEVTNRDFDAGAISNVGGFARLTISPGIDWLMGGTITTENVARLRNLAGGNASAIAGLSGTLNVRRVSATEFDLVAGVIPGATPRTEAPIAWVAGMEAVSGRLEVKTGLKQFFRPIASVAESPGGQVRVTLGVPFPPFGLSTFYVAGMRLGGVTGAVLASLKRWHLASWVSDGVLDLPVTWASEMASLTGELHTYLNSRLGAVEGDEPATGIWLSERDVDGARVIGNNFKAPLRGFVNEGDFTRYDLNSFEPGRAGADTVPLPQTVALLTTNDIIGTASQHKGPEANVVSRNGSREGVHFLGVHMRTSGPEILRVERGSAYVVGGRNNAGGGQGSRSAISILPDALKVNVIGGDFTNVEVVDPTNGAVHPRAKFSFVGPRPSYAEEDSADMVLVGANFEIFSENWPGDVGLVPTIGVRFRPQRWDTTNALTAGQAVGHIEMRSYTGAAAGAERIFGRVTGYAETTGSSPDGAVAVHVLDNGVLRESARFGKLGVTLHGSPTLSTAPANNANDLRIASTAWVRANIEAPLLAQIQSLQQQINDLLGNVDPTASRLGIDALPMTLA